jgi:hypothetical protein
LCAVELHRKAVIAQSLQCLNNFPHFLVAFGYEKHFGMKRERKSNIDIEFA